MRVAARTRLRSLAGALKPNGKPQHVLGLLGQFERTATANARMLGELAATGVDLVGVDPSMTLAYRAEYAIGNEILTEIYRVNSLHVRLIRYDADSMRPVQVVPAMREHLDFLHALAMSDAEGALARIMAHIEQSKHRVLGGMLRAEQV